MASSAPPTRAPAAQALRPLVEGGLLPAKRGHVARAARLRPMPADAIEAFLPRVADALRASRSSGLEHGFLAYAPQEADAPLVAEDDSVGSPDEIRWHWHAPESTVALSFHTHPGAEALCIPSGMDLVGALVRGDHIVYVLTMDGRLTGWRFRDPKGHPRAVDSALRALADARRLYPGVVDFLYDAFDALRPSLVKPVYAARVTLDPVGASGWRAERVHGDAAFFSEEERERGAVMPRARAQARA